MSKLAQHINTRAVHAHYKHASLHSVLGHGNLVGALSPVGHKGLESGLRETVIKRYVVERTNNAEIRPEEQSEKAERFREKKKKIKRRKR